MYFSWIFTSLLWHKEAILTQLLSICENSDKFAPTCKFLTSNDKATLTYSYLKNTFFTFYKPDPAIFELLNSLDLISLTS